MKHFKKYLSRYGALLERQPFSKQSNANTDVRKSEVLFGGGGGGGGEEEGGFTEEKKNCR